MLDTHVDALGDDAMPDTLVDNDTKGTRSYVEDSASLSVVKLVWHAFLEGSISLDVYVVSPLVDPQVCGQVLHTMLPKVPRKEVPRSSPVTLGVHHGSTCAG